MDKANKLIGVSNIMSAVVSEKSCKKSVMNVEDRNKNIRIGVFGRKGSGKSSLIKALIRHGILLKSRRVDESVDKANFGAIFDFPPLGRVSLVDTSEIEDISAMDRARKRRTNLLCSGVDIAVIVSESGLWGGFEELLARRFSSENIPFLVVITKSDLLLKGAVISVPNSIIYKSVKVSSLTGEGLEDLRRAVIAAYLPEQINLEMSSKDSISKCEIVILVVNPERSEKEGHINVNQARLIRDFLKSELVGIVVKDKDLPIALAALAGIPKIVAADSEIIIRVIDEAPPGIYVTSASVMISYFNNILRRYAEGLAVLARLKAGDRLLLSYACARHPEGCGIDKAELLKKLTVEAGGHVALDYCYGQDLPDNLYVYDLVINCDSCILTNSEIRLRLARCAEAGAPVTSFGLAAAFVCGFVERILEPFPREFQIYKSVKNSVAAE